jgi:Leucine-rich repeat (LRR) protein
LARNQLRALDSNILRGLRNLTILNLEGNELDQVPTSAISGLRTLRKLNLGGNSLIELQSTSFPSSLENLIQLNLTDNRLTTIRKLNLPNLKELLLAKNNLKEITISALKNLRSLEVLDLSSNFLDFVPIESITGLRNLKRLNLGSNNILTIEENTFSSVELPKLEFLDLSRNQLANLNGKNILSGLLTFKSLNLAYNQISNLPDNLFAKNNFLEVVDLQGNQLDKVERSFFQIRQFHNNRLVAQPTQRNRNWRV